jgi:hypothetical protein
MTGFLAGLAVGAAREVYKVRHGGRCEYSSMAYDIAGSVLGSYSANRWYIAPSKKSLSVGYIAQF